MQIELKQAAFSKKLDFYGGIWGAIIPFILFISGVIFIALSGAPDEKGFWPVLISALTLGLLLAKERNMFCTIVIQGMSEQIVMIMISAWIIASSIGVLMTETGFVEALIWIASLLKLNGIGIIISTFIICCIVSLSTGSSFATILICSPILYPTGGLLGAHLPTLAGAIIGGATFGDFIAPISDTTIASALSQKAEIGATVRSRAKYIIPVVAVALIAYTISGILGTTEAASTNNLSGSPNGLPMLLVPALIIYLFLQGKHLLYGLLVGLAFGTLLGWGTGLLAVDQIISLDLDNFTAKSFIIDGINRAVGLSFFTILLMGLVATLKASGLIDQLVQFAEQYSHTTRHAESWIASVASLAVLLTTHSIVAVLMVTEFSNKTGEKMNIPSIRRANILSLVVCVFPFLFPYFIPVILMANTTSSGAEFNIPSVSPLEAGLHNFVAWGLLGMVFFVVLGGYGRKIVD